MVMSKESDERTLLHHIRHKESLANPQALKALLFFPYKVLSHWVFLVRFLMREFFKVPSLTQDPRVKLEGEC